jgi:hypothetical protein
MYKKIDQNGDIHLSSYIPKITTGDYEVVEVKQVNRATFKLETVLREQPTYTLDSGWFKIDEEKA